MIGYMIKHDWEARNARQEFQRRVDPEELRTWAYSQLQAEAESGASRKAAAAWPAAFPTFPGSELKVFLHHGQKKSDGSNVVLVWHFGGAALKVSVFLEPDGSPVDFEDDPPWSTGIDFTYLRK